MAGENQNTGPNIQKGSSPAEKQAKEQIGVTKDVKKEAGDYRDILRDSVRELEKTLRTYDKLEAKLVAIKKETLNVKQLESQIQQIKEKRLSNDKKVADLEESLNQKNKEAAKKFNESIALQQKLESDIIKNKSQGFDGLAKKQEYQLMMLAKFIERQSQSLTVDELSYANALKQQQLDDQIFNLTKQQLDKENQIKENIGVTGFLAGKFAEKLGISDKFYEKMVLKARDANKELTISEKATLLWNSATESISESFNKLKKDPAVLAAALIATYKAVEALFSKVGDLARGVATGISDFMSMTGDQVISKMGKGVSDLVSKIPLFGGLLSGLVDGFTTILDLSLKEDDKITKIGRELGVSRAEAGQISERFERIATNSGNALISGRGLVESQKELSKELGVTNVLSGEILATNIELGKLAGLDAKTRASIAQSSIITGQSAKSITESVLGQVGALKAATGISFNYQKILSEAANLSGVLGLQFAKYPEKLSNALVTTKAMGLELSKLDSMADTFLDFESSISKEFEAQLLTGKEINLAKAREAFLNNDLATAAAEITRQVGSASEFLSMNRIQQDAIAGAMGMSKNEMADMLKQQEMFAKLGAQDLKSAQARVEELKAEGKTREEISKMIGEDAYQSMVNASAQEKIAGFLEKIQSAVGNFLASSPIVGIINQALDFLSKPESITNIVEKVQGFLATVFDIVGGVAAAIIGIANSWPFNAGIDESILDMALSGGDSIRSMNLTSPVTVSDNVAKNQASPGTVSSPSGNTLQQTPQTIILNTKNEFTAPGVQTQQIDNNPLNQAVNSPAQIKNTKR